MKRKEEAPPEEHDESSFEEPLEEDEEEDGEHRGPAASHSSPSAPAGSHLFPDTDWDQSYYRICINGYQTSDVKSAMQKEIRRNNPAAARFWAAILLGSHKVENLMNRLVVIASEDISIADNSILLMAARVHRIYASKRQALEKTKEKGAWKKLRNDVELRTLIGYLVTRLAEAPKTRITDHALSYFSYPIEKDTDEPEYVTLPDNPKAAVSLPSFRSLVDRLVEQAKKGKDASYSRGLEEEAFEYLRKIIRPSRGYQALGKKVRPVINFQKKKYATALSCLRNGVSLLASALGFPSQDPRHKALRNYLDDLCDLCLHRVATAAECHACKGLPGKVELAHALLLFTRPYQAMPELFRPRLPGEDSEISNDLIRVYQEALISEDRKKAYLAGEAESTARYARIIADSEHLPVPQYALDRHTISAADRSFTGFFTREHEALSPKAADIFDPYYEKVLETMKIRDAKEGNNKGPASKKRRKSPAAADDE